MTKTTRRAGRASGARSKARSRPATYGTAGRVARIVWGLVSRPYGWSFEAIQNEMRISERTLLRYLKVCREELLDSKGMPLVEVVRRGERRLLRLAESARTPDSTSYQALSFYFALTVLRFLEGTILKDGVDDLWERFRATLPENRRALLADFERKLFTVPYAVKEYAGFDDMIDVLLRSLVAQRRLRITYAGLWRGETRVHDFDPYTLVLYRGGLYLVGKSHLYRKIVYLAVERIQALDTTEERFDYPRRYSPEQHTDGVFGIVDGDETEVAIRIRTEQGAGLLQSRRLHPTQRFEKQPDGSTILTMTVRGTEELKNWVLGLGPWVEVVQPPDLRDEVARAHAEAAAVYGR